MLKCNSFRKKAMNDLADCTGEIVYVNYVTARMPSLIVGEMDYVSQFDFIMVQSLKIVKKKNNKIIASPFHFKIPFIGEGVAIQKINIEDEGRNRVVYDNFLIRNDYSLADPTRVSELKDIIFGNFKSG